MVKSNNGNSNMFVHNWNACREYTLCHYCIASFGCCGVEGAPVGRPYSHISKWIAEWTLNYLIPDIKEMNPFVKKKKNSIIEKMQDKISGKRDIEQ